MQDLDSASIRSVEQLLRGSAIGLALSVAGMSAYAQETSDKDAEPVQIGTVSIEDEGGQYKAEQASPKATAALVDTPRSVTIVTEKVLQDTGATNLVEALRTVPGITMAMGEGGQPFADRPFIRGSESTSGILVDGMRDSSSQSRDVFNLEQIEVSKGSNGPLAGRGAAGGSLNLVTISAKPKDSYAATIQAGNAEHLRATADVNKAISESVAVRMAVMVQESGVPGRDEVTDDRWGVTPTISFGMNGPTRVDATYTHYEGDGLIDYGHPLNTVTGKPVTGIDPDNFYGLVNRDFHDTEQDVGQIEVNHDLNDATTLRFITRYSDTSNAYIATNPDDSQGNVVNGLVYRNTKSSNSQNETFATQADILTAFATGGIEHSLAAGLEYTKEETDRATYSVALLNAMGESIGRGECNLVGVGAPSGYNCTDLYNPNPLDPWTGEITLRDPTTTEAETVGAYIFDTMTLSEKWLVNVGLRWDDFSTETSSGLSNDDTLFNYQVGVVYKPAPNASVYASYATSASPSGVTAGDGGDNISTTNQDLKPEKSKNYEVGVKWEVFKRRLALNAAVFRTDTEDAHVATSTERGGPQQAIGEQRVQGVELTAVGAITDAWNISAGYSYLDSEIKDAGPVNTDQVGNKLPNTPEHSFNVWSTYVFPAGLTVGGGATYVDERYGNTANTKSVDDYWRYDLMLGYDVSDHIAFQLNVQNLTDERYYERVYATHMATVAPGRSIIGSLRFKY